jgi:hypothetical protein
MSSVAPSPPEQGQLVSVRSRQWVVSVVRPSTLPSPALKSTFDGPPHLLTLASVEDDGRQGGPAPTVSVASRSIITLFSPDEETFTNSLLWKNLLLQTCTALPWEGVRDCKQVAVWGGKEQST